MDTQTPTLRALDLLALHHNATRDAVERGDKQAAAKGFETIESMARAEMLRLSPLRPSGGVVHEPRPMRDMLDHQTIKPVLGLK